MTAAKRARPSRETAALPTIPAPSGNQLRDWVKLEIFAQELERLALERREGPSSHLFRFMADMAHAWVASRNRASAAFYEIVRPKPRGRPRKARTPPRARGRPLRQPRENDLPYLEFFAEHLKRINAECGYECSELEGLRRLVEETRRAAGRRLTGASVEAKQLQRRLSAIRRRNGIASPRAAKITRKS